MRTPERLYIQYTEPFYFERRKYATYENNVFQFLFKNATKPYKLQYDLVKQAQDALPCVA